MASLISCRACRGFVVASARSCPHCDAPVAHSKLGTIVRGALAVAGGSAMALTLSACYGPSGLADCRTDASNKPPYCFPADLAVVDLATAVEDAGLDAAVTPDASSDDLIR